ncbi:MAG: enolase C-terminal domain-like protein [Chloroflexota bacterium]
MASLTSWASDGWRSRCPQRRLRRHEREPPLFSISPWRAARSPAAPCRARDDLPGLLLTSSSPSRSSWAASGRLVWNGELARLHGLGCVPHTSGSIIGIAAALHTLATIPDASTSPATVTPFLEVGTDPNPWRTDLPTTDILVLEDGFVGIPPGPGLGVDIDEAFLRAQATSHQVVRG